MSGGRFLAATLAAALTLCMSGQGWAQAYPQRPVKLIVPAPPGGPTDVPARLVADGLNKMLGQPFVPPPTATPCSSPIRACWRSIRRCTRTCPMTQGR